MNDVTAGLAAFAYWMHEEEQEYLYFCDPIAVEVIRKGWFEQELNEHEVIQFFSQRKSKEALSSERLADIRFNVLQYVRIFPQQDQHRFSQPFDRAIRQVYPEYASHPLPSSRILQMQPGTA